MRGSVTAVRVTASFTPLEDFSVPGFTVRFVKSSLIMADETGVIRSLLLGGGANKPLGLTPVMRGGRPLQSGEEVVLRAGETYWVRVGVVGGEELTADLPDLVFRAFNEGVVRCVGVEVEATSLSTPVKGQPMRVTIETITPAIIRVKTMDGGSVTVTAPTLRDLLATPLRVLGRILWETNGINIPTAWAWRIAKHYAQINAWTRKATVTIKPNQQTTAVTGKWEYIATAKLPTYLQTTLQKTLTIAKTIGIGKSRGIGFGQTNIKTKP